MINATVTFYTLNISRQYGYLMDIKCKFSIRYSNDALSKKRKFPLTADLVIFTEEILNEKRHFLYNDVLKVQFPPKI